MTKSIGSEKVKFDETGTPYFERVISEDGTTKKVTMEENGFVKQLEVSIVIRREGFSPSMEKRVWFGLQKIRFQIPENDSNFRDAYLFFAKGMSFPCLRWLGQKADYCETLDLQPFTKGDMTVKLIEKIGKAERVTGQRARVLLQSKEILGVYNDFENQLAERV